MMWGRLGYDPGLDRTFFEATLHARYTEVPSDLLYDTWARVSRIINQVNSFHWQDWDFQWNYEICSSIHHFHSVEDFISNPSMEGSGILSIQQYVNKVNSGKSVESRTPKDIIENLELLSKQTLEGLDYLKSREIKSAELNYLLLDIETMAQLGNYYAKKISGAIKSGYVPQNQGRELSDSGNH